MKAPTSLRHKPLVSLDDYCHLDGPYADNTDAQALSIGIPQYSDEPTMLNITLSEIEFSAKVWRHTQKRWSRMSEELPIHRILDLTILYLSVLVEEQEESIGFQSIMKEHNRNGGEELIRENYQTNKNIFEPRLQTIKKLLEYLDHKVLTK